MNDSRNSILQNYNDYQFNEYNQFQLNYILIFFNIY